ncbi:MAG: ABC transporter substrate-binding protein [Pseudomonadota bacterium]
MAHFAQIIRTISVLFIIAIASPAAADEGAETFIQSLSSDAFNIINGDAPEAERRENLRSFLSSNINFRRVSGFALGQYGRQITPDQREEFITLFTSYSLGLYEEQLFRYAGQTMTVTKSVDRSARDVIVYTTVSSKDPQLDGLEVMWRVAKGKNGGYSVFDVGAEGVWLVIAKRDEYTSIIANNGGGERGMAKLLEDLRAQVAAL